MVLVKPIDNRMPPVNGAPRTLSPLATLYALAIIVIAGFGALLQMFNGQLPFSTCELAPRVAEVKFATFCGSDIVRDHLVHSPHGYADTTMWVIEGKLAEKQTTAEENFKVAFGINDLSELTTLSADKVKCDVQWSPLRTYMRVDPRDMTHSIMRGIREVHAPGDNDNRSFLVLKLEEVTTGALYTQIVHIQYTDYMADESHSLNHYVTTGPLVNGTGIDASTVKTLARIAHGFPMEGRDGRTYRLACATS